MMHRVARSRGVVGVVAGGAAAGVLGRCVLGEEEFTARRHALQASTSRVMAATAVRIQTGLVEPNTTHSKASVIDSDKVLGPDAIQNWSNTHVCKAERLFKPSSQKEVEQIVRAVSEAGQKLRVFGSGLSPNGIGFSDTNLISLEQMNRVIKVDSAKKQITVEAGALVGQVLDELKEYDLTLQNLASINQQQIGGFIQVGAHGTGATLPPVDEQVVELKVVTPGLGTITLSKEKHPEWFKFVKVGLGCFGIVTQVTLQCVDAHLLEEDTVVMTRAQVKQGHAKRLQSNRHVRYMWIPYTDACVVVTSNPATMGASHVEPDQSGEAHAERVAPMVDLLQKTSRLSERQIKQANAMGFGDLRDWLLRSGDGCLDTEHVRQVNQAESEFWKLNEFEGLVDDSFAVLGFDCGGQQQVLEVALGAGTQSEPNGDDLLFVEKLLNAIETEGLPAPAPIEQRWSCGSSAAMSVAPSIADMAPHDVLCSWVGIIMYLPSEDPGSRGLVFNKFVEYKKLLQRVAQDSGIDVRTHWAKIEVPGTTEEIKDLQQQLASQYPLKDFEALRRKFDPKGMLLNRMMEVILGGEPVPPTPAASHGNPTTYNI
mmetsp:Transcript_19845/g.36807  ORF Transcript_19845/g.36807 Transcript_19845/m.36807 type:complete len:597 (-) Transcript_19845:548-2338(-)